MKKFLFVYYLLPLLLGVAVVVAESAGGSPFRRKPPVTNQSTSPTGRNTTDLLPGHIEAEAYSAMQGIQLETTADQDGGPNITNIDDGDWMDYDVNVASSGVYTFRFRVANGWGDGATFELRRADGTTLKTVQVPRTGGLQSWQTLTATVHLTAGEQTLRLFVVKGNWNFNWLEAAPGRSLPGKLEAETFDVASDVRFESTSDEGGGQNVNYIDDGDWMDYNVSVATAGPYTLPFRVANSYGNGIIYLKAEDGSTLASVNVPRTGGWQNWTTISTTATLPAGSQVLRIYTNPGTWSFNWLEVKKSGAPLPGHIEAEAYSAMQGIQLEATADQGGGPNITSIDDGDWMDYPVNVATARSLYLSLPGGQRLGRRGKVRAAPGRWHYPENRRGAPHGWSAKLADAHRHGSADGGRARPCGCLWLRATGTSTGWRLHPVAACRASWKPRPSMWPAMFASSQTSDEGGGQNVNYIDDGDWMDYNVSVATAGPYTFAFRVANSYGNGDNFRKGGGRCTLASVNVPRTGGWQNWTTIQHHGHFASGQSGAAHLHQSRHLELQLVRGDPGRSSAESSDYNVRGVTQQNGGRSRFCAGSYQHKYRYPHYVYVV